MLVSETMLVLSYFLVGVLPHVMGVPTIASFDQPEGVGVVADQSFTFSWQDNDADMTANFSMYYQPVNLPPNGRVDQLDATPIPNGQAMPIMDPDDSLTWDTSGVPAGSYFLFSITREDDPTLPESFGASNGVVTVRHAGDPLFPAVIVTEPGAIAPPVGDGFAIRWEASGDGPLTATVRGKPRDAAGGYEDLIVDMPLEADGATQRGCYVWDLGLEPIGYYEVQVEVKDGAGRTHTAYPVNAITLLRDPAADAGPRPTCATPAEPDAGVDDADGGVAADAAPGGSDDGGSGCHVAGGRGDAAGLLLVGLALLALRRRAR